VVAAAFSAILANQYRTRRRPYQLVWCFSLALGAVAALAFVVFLAADRNLLAFRLYYACGALLMAAYLGLGSVYLHAPRRVAGATALSVMALSVVGLILLFTTPVPAAPLHASNVEAGTRLVSGAVVAFIAILNAFGAIAVIGGALYSAWRLIRGQGPPRLLVANVLIAGGTILASLAGTLARVTSSGAAFWGLLAAGFIVLFAGFLFTLPRRVRALP